MGPRTLLDNLGVPGIYVNWDEDQNDGIYIKEGPNGMTVGINADIENLPFFLPALRYALEEFGGGACIDRVIWKAEGALAYLDRSQQSYNYWFDTLTSILALGGSALIQSLCLIDRVHEEDYYLRTFEERLNEKGNGSIAYNRGYGAGAYIYSMYVQNFLGGPMGVFY